MGLFMRLCYSWNVTVLTCTAIPFWRKSLRIRGLHAVAVDRAISRFHWTGHLLHDFRIGHNTSPVSQFDCLHPTNEWKARSESVSSGPGTSIGLHTESTFRRTQLRFGTSTSEIKFVKNSTWRFAEDNFCIKSQQYAWSDCDYIVKPNV